MGEDKFSPVVEQKQKYAARKLQHVAGYREPRFTTDNARSLVKLPSTDYNGDRIILASVSDEALLFMTCERDTDPVNLSAQ